MRHDKSTAGLQLRGITWDAYEPVYREHRDRLYQLALLLTRGDRASAEDIVSDVFIQAQRPWAEGRIDDFGAYVRRAAVNRFNSQARHDMVVGRFVHRWRADDRGMRDMADQAADRQSLWDALGTLPPRQRAAVVLRYYEGLSIDETAELLGVTSGTVKSQAFDALRALRRFLGSPDED